LLDALYGERDGIAATQAERRHSGLRIAIAQGT